MSGNHSTMYFVFLQRLVICLGCLGGHVFGMLATGVCRVECIGVPGLAAGFGG